MKRHWRNLFPYLVALLATLLVFAVRLWLIGNSFPGTLFAIPIVLAAWLGGFKPGFFATLLLAGVGPLLWFLREGNVEGGLNPARMTALVLIGAAISWLFESLHRARRRVEERQRQLEVEIQHRLKAEAAERQQREILKEADRRKDQFLATLAHELRNPLAPLSNALQLWPMVENDRLELESLRELMDRQVQQMIRLIDDLMDVSRITRGKIELREQTIDLGTVLQSAVEATQPLIQACGHHLTAVIPDQPLLIEGDVARLVQVVGNLLNNAAKYTGRNGHIWLTGEVQDAQAVIRVRDAGPGIPEEMLSQVFDVFVQVDSTLDRSHGGLGVGLTLCKSLVELHGGTIEARSEGSGKGSEFVVRLPALEAGARVAELGRLPVRTSGALPAHRILVVDDVQASAKTLAMMLRGLGQNVDTAHDGPSAIQTVQVCKPDVAFLDIAMPGMDGYEVARALRQKGDLKDLVLVALTGYGQEDDRRQAFDAGFNHHMVKPASVDALQQLLLTVPAREHRLEALGDPGS